MEVNLPLWLILGLAGALGQLLRSLIGVKKAIDREEYIAIGKIFWTTIIGMMAGGIAGVFTNDWKLAFTTGYAATDTIEGVFKIASGSEKVKKEE